MREFFHSIKFKILICIGALLLGFMAYVAVSAGIETLPERIIGSVTYPFVTASNAISEGVTGFIDKLINADTYKRQNEELTAQLTEMYKEIVDYEEIKQENESLREMLGLKQENSDFVFSEPCNIIARNSNDIYGGFTINRGSDHGLSVNDPIITTVGLVGRVTAIAPNYAKVTTILSPDVNVGVYTTRAKVTGVLENDLTTAQDGRCLMSDILRDADIKEGDIIFTSGKSGLFPEDVMVGTVVGVYDDSNGLSKHAVIELAENYFSITKVYAVVDFEGKGLDFPIDE